MKIRCRNCDAVLAEKVSDRNIDAGSALRADDFEATDNADAGSDWSKGKMISCTSCNTANVVVEEGGEKKRILGEVED
jgi:phage FluMu protein Com